MDDILGISYFFEQQRAAADCNHDTLAHQRSPSRTDLEPKDKKVNVKIKPAHHTAAAVAQKFSSGRGSVPCVDVIVPYTVGMGMHEFRDACLSTAIRQCGEYLIQNKRISCSVRG